MTMRRRGSLGPWRLMADLATLLASSAACGCTDRAPEIYVSPQSPVVEIGQAVQAAETPGQPTDADHVVAETGQTDQGSSQPVGGGLAGAEVIEPLTRSAENHLARASAYLKAAEYDAAIEEFTQALRLNHDCAECYFGRGFAFLEKGFPDTAIQDFVQAIRLKRDHAEAYCQRGRAHAMLGDAVPALADLTQAIRMKPLYAAAYFHRGTAYLDRGDYDRAIGDFTEAKRLDSSLAEQVQIKIADAHMRHGLDSLSRHNWDDAITLLAKAVELDPARAEWLNVKRAKAFRNRGREKAEEWNYPAAIGDFTAVIDLTPTDAEAYYLRGQIYEKVGKPERARRDFDRAERLGYHRKTPRCSQHENNSDREGSCLPTADFN